MKRYIGLLSAVCLLLAGCSKWTDTMASPWKKSVSVSVHGVNYTADSFQYVVVDPKDPSNRAGGEHIEPFGGGGIMCCYTLPKQWTPGIKVNVRSTHWLPENAKGELPEVEKVYTVEVPRYPNGKAGELWVLRTADGGIELVSSDVEPGHPQWPGKVKGWPVPSLAYQRERWALYRKLAEDGVARNQDLLEELRTKPKAHLQEMWEFDKEHNPEVTNKLDGPEDARYAEFRRKRYTDGLERSKAELERVLRDKP